MLDWVLIIFGTLLTINCGVGIVTREGMYSKSSTALMTWAQILGFFAGAAIASLGVNSLMNRM